MLRLLCFQDLLFRILPLPITGRSRQSRSISEADWGNSRSEREGLLLVSHSNIYSSASDCLSQPGENVCRSRAFLSLSSLGEAMQLSRPRRQLITMGTLSDAKSSITPVTLVEFTWGMPINYTLDGVPGATSIKLWLRILNSLNAGPMR